jgi:Rrf2 family protein
MVKMSTKSRYGTRLVLDMARHYGRGPVQLADIARRQQVSVKYLEQLVIPLKTAGLIESVRGVKGGYLLAMEPRLITVGRVVDVLESGQNLVPCTDDPQKCRRAPFCATRCVWVDVERAIRETLDSYTYQDLLEMEDTLMGGRGEDHVQPDRDGSFYESEERGSA